MATKTIEQIKDEVAVKHGHKNWWELLKKTHNDIKLQPRFVNIENEAMQLYAKQMCEEHTETVLRSDGSVYKQVHYIEHLELRLQIVKGEIKEPLFYRNEHGGMTEIDEFSCSDYRPFKRSDFLLHELIKEQCKKRMALIETNKNQT